jgi:hypothetical protein
MADVKRLYYHLRIAIQELLRYLFRQSVEQNQSVWLPSLQLTAVASLT